ncbi:MAG: beta-ketoacyl synthase N-terminal-like domain-containing protein, partial [Candidatus Xenobia bacterium]
MKNVAIVGMAGLFPKAGGLKQFWHVLRAGVDCITDVPSTHWNSDALYDADPKSPDRTYCKRGGFLSPVAFDPTEFSIPPSALEATDTSQLLGLVAAKAALEDAGYGAARVFDRARTGVILGVTGCLELVIPLGARLGHPMWRKALQQSGVPDHVAEDVMARISDGYVPWQENSFPGLLGNVVAGRISNRLNLQGTNCVVDAACASSHAAAHMALMELSSGYTDMVVTGGVDTFNDIFMFVCFSKTPALSPSGDIRPFSDQADGTVLGEGIGMVVLKRLEDAERDGDRIYAVIRGMGTSSDGEGQAVYAPSPEGQQKALRRAYEVAGVSPDTIELVEAHGTGTRVGDVVEFEALRAVYGEQKRERPWCALGTVKSQIGHTKAAAGSAALIKTALALYHKVLPPTLKVSRPNPRMEVGNSPFYLNTQARPWLASDKHPRRAALSSFGFGGSNYHMVLEEHRPQRQDVAWDGSVELVMVSAESRTALATRLRQGARRDFNPAHPCRYAAVAPDVEDAASRIERGETPRDGFYGKGAAPGQVAFLFPGQGSQYVAMARELACLFPEMLEALQEAPRDVV